MITTNRLLDNSEQLNQPDILMPITFAATNCQFICKASNEVEEYWCADIKAVRKGSLNRIFNQILFIETPGEMVFLAGIESPDGIDREIDSERSLRQAEFIHFLRKENQRRIGLGIVSCLFEGIQYESEGKATAAYLAVRSLSHPFGIGFFDADNEYKLMGITPGIESGFDGSLYLPFDQLGV